MENKDKVHRGAPIYPADDIGGQLGSSNTHFGTGMGGNTFHDGVPTDGPAAHEPGMPKWWGQSHEAAWEKAREGMQQEWQLRDPAVFHGETQPTRQEWAYAEPAIRYGFGAYSQHGHDSDWGDGVIAKLSEEWQDLRHGRTWDEVKTFVRRGWDAARRQA